jgi:hypothetical protein
MRACLCVRSCCDASVAGYTAGSHGHVEMQGTCLTVQSMRCLSSVMKGVKINIAIILAVVCARKCFKHFTKNNCGHSCSANASIKHEMSISGPFVSTVGLLWVPPQLSYAKTTNKVRTVAFLLTVIEFHPLTPKITFPFWYTKNIYFLKWTSRHHSKTQLHTL